MPACPKLSAADTHKDVNVIIFYLLAKKYLKIRN
jgi:hypothetical protein